MLPFPIARVVIFILAVAFVASLLFYGLSGGGRERQCPPEKPVRVEDGSCVPESFLEGTFCPAGGAEVIRALLAGLMFAAPTCAYLLWTWPGK